MESKAFIAVLPLGAHHKWSDDGQIWCENSACMPNSTLCALSIQDETQQHQQEHPTCNKKHMLTTLATSGVPQFECNAQQGTAPVSHAMISNSAGEMPAWRMMSLPTYARQLQR
jgi:hypothetical protein